MAAELENLQFEKSPQITSSEETFPIPAGFEQMQVTEAQSIASAFAPTNIDNQLIEAIPFMDISGLEGLLQAHLGEDLNKIVTEEIEKRTGREEMNLRVRATEKLMQEVNIVNQFFHDRLPPIQIGQSRFMKKLSKWANNACGINESAENPKIFPEPRRNAIRVVYRKLDFNTIRSAAGTILALVGGRGIGLEFANIARAKAETFDTRLSTFGINILKFAGIWGDAYQTEKTTWETMVHRMSARTVSYPVALNGRSTASTSDFSNSEDGRKRAEGALLVPITINVNLEGAFGAAKTDSEFVNATSITHHQIDGENHIKLANEISLDELSSGEDEFTQVAEIVAKAIQVLSDKEKLQAITGRKALKAISYYETASAEYGMEMEEVKSENISLSINGYEVILKIKNEDGSFKSKGEIFTDLEKIIEIAKKADVVKSALAEIEKDNPKMARKIFDQLKRKNLSASIIDVRGSTLDEKTLRAANTYIATLKRTHSKENPNVSRFEELSTCLFRLSLNVPSEAVNGNLTQSINEFEEARTQLHDIGATEVFDLGRKFKIEYKDVREFQKALEKSTPETIETLDEEYVKFWNEIKNNTREYLRKMLSISEMSEEEKQKAELKIKMLTGDAKILEAITYAIGEHPVNCVMPISRKTGLQITNTFLEIDTLKNALQQAYNAILTRESRFTIQPEDSSALRVTYVKALERITKTIQEAQIGKSINSDLIDLTRRVGYIYASSPLFIRSLIKTGFLSAGRILPAFKPAQDLLNQLGKIEVKRRRGFTKEFERARIAAETEKWLTSMIKPVRKLKEDTTGTVTVSCPKTPRGKAGVGCTAAFDKETEMYMINMMPDGKIVITFRGEKAAQSKEKFTRGLHIFKDVIKAGYRPMTLVA